MSGFVATGGSDTDVTVANNGFFPDISLTDARNALRLDGTVVDARLKQAVIAAMLEINQTLLVFQTAQVAAGKTTLASVTDNNGSVGGMPRLVFLYRHAVFSLAKASLVERYRDFDSSGDGNKRADDLSPTIDEYRRDSRWAVNDILGRSRVTVELI